MAHVRPGKTAKRNRRLNALERLRAELDFNDRLSEQWSVVGKEPTKAQVKHRIRIKSEIAALESRI